MNFVILMGRTTADIELRQTSTGKSVVNFNLAVDRQFTKDTTDFISCTAWEKTAETLSKYVKKGQKIAIWGSLQNREWTDKQGNKRTVTEVVASEFFFCESKGNGSTNNAPASNSPSQSNFVPSAYTNTAAPDFEEIGTDEGLPF